MVSFQRAAELQALLEGVALPATRQELIDYAAQQADGAFFEPELTMLPDREFRSLDEVGEGLAAVQPDRTRGRPGAPEPESGLPPGGDAYTDPAPKPGAVREQGPRG